MIQTVESMLRELSIAMNVCWQRERMLPADRRFRERRFWQ